MNISHRLVLHFPSKIVDRPIISKLVRDYALDFNILKANITQEKEGWMVLEISGNEKDYNKGIKYLKDVGVGIQPLSHDIKRNEERCTHCGACIGFCPSAALFFERPNMNVIFDEEKCIACEICIKACPPRAMEVHF